MTGLGERLKEARNRKGFTLDDLQEITKIQKRYLAGIENEEYDGMPGSFYIRAFIKQYAEAVDLDADEMLDLYRGSSGKQEELKEEEQQMATPTLSRSRTRSTSQFNEVMPKIIVALFIIVILLVLTFLWRHKATNKSELEINTDNPVQVEDQSKAKQEDQGKKDNEADDKTAGSDNSSDEDNKADKEEAVEDDEVDEENQETQTVEHLSVSGENSTYKLTNSDTFKLEIRTKGPSWIGVMDENQNELSPEARTMEAGEKLELDVSDVEKVRIRVGRTGETEIYVNGELLDYASDAITQNIHIEYEKE